MFTRSTNDGLVLLLSAIRDQLFFGCKDDGNHIRQRREAARFVKSITVSLIPWLFFLNMAPKLVFFSEREKGGPLGLLQNICVLTMGL